MSQPVAPATDATALSTVACPQCGAGYQVPIAKLAAKPRKLKCAQCAHVWVAALPAAVVTEGVPSALPEAASNTEPTPDAPATHTPPKPAPEPEAEPEVEPSPPAMLEMSEVLKPAWHAYVFGEQKWLTLAFIMVLAGLGAAVFTMMQSLPQTPAAPEPEPTRQARALKPVPAPQGVVMHQVEAHAYQIEEGTVLQLQGRIANLAKTLTALPHLQAELLDDAGAVQDFWPVTLVTTTLPAQSEIPFTVSFTNPLGQAWRLIWVN